VRQLMRPRWAMLKTREIPVVSWAEQMV